MLNTFRYNYPNELSHYTDEELMLIIDQYMWKADDIMKDVYIDEILKWQKFETYLDAAECLFIFGLDDEFYDDKNTQVLGKQQDMAKELLINSGFTFIFVESTASVLVYNSILY